jgi:hypothetical protein
MEPGKMESGEKPGKTEPEEMLGVEEGAHVGTVRWWHYGSAAEMGPGKSRQHGADLLGVGDDDAGHRADLLDAGAHSAATHAGGGPETRTTMVARGGSRSRRRRSGARVRGTPADGEVELGARAAVELRALGGKGGH